MPVEQYVIDDKIWEELIQLTNGAAAVCYQCGVCTAICPWGLVRKETLSIRSYLRQAQLGIRNGNDNLWLCTTCAQCEVYCPRGVNIAEVFRGLRYLSWERNNPHEGLPTLLWSVFWNGNPWEQPPSHRARWAKDLSLPEFQSDKHEILYYVGCTTSFDNRAQNIARALIAIFNSADVRFGVLGDIEPCSGEEVLSVGHKPYFKDIADGVKKTFNDRGISKVITTSPHSYDVFRNHYPVDEQDPISPLHYTQYLDQLIKEKRLRFNQTYERKITYHDPCYLSRHNQVIQSPRMVLSAIPGVELVEMDNAGKDTLCCGGGGGRMWLETDIGERFSDLRIEEALATDAEVLATACPYCISCLEDSLKSRGVENIAVMDVAEIAASALETT